MKNYVCPICKGKLNKEQNSMKCVQGHTFDFARQGYLNLLKRHSKKIMGDSKEMLVARDIFLHYGYYDVIPKTIVALIKKYFPNKMIEIADIGCGTGYYLSYIQNEFEESANCYGSDISKEAVKISARRNKSCNWCVCSNIDLPYADNSFDLVFVSFAPFELSEINRVLKDEGYFIVVTPNEDHLLQMREIIYEEVFKKPAKLQIGEFEVVENIRIVDTVTLFNNEITQLFKMTPHYFKTSTSINSKLKSITKLDLTLDFNVTIYKREKQ